jgi:hypothetical protein
MVSMENVATTGPAAPVPVEFIAMLKTAATAEPVALLFGGL